MSQGIFVMYYYKNFNIYRILHDLEIHQLLSCRCWFAKRGINFNLNRRRKKKRLSIIDSFERKISWDTLNARVDWEIRQRRVNARIDLFFKFHEKYIKLVSLLNTNIKHWINVDQRIIPDIERLWKDKIKFERVYTKQSEVTVSKITIFNNFLHEIFISLVIN